MHDANCNSDTILLPEAKAVQIPSERTILIVEDDATLASLLTWQLQHQGYAVVAVESARLALNLARIARPQLVLMDIDLPDGSGLEVCAQLDAWPHTSNIPVIIVSGSDVEEPVKQSRAAGSRFFVSKPYDPNVLLALIDQTMSAEEEWF